MNEVCERVRPLMPAYLDGELGEESARELRHHLMDCQPCRTAAQGERALKRWFQAPVSAEVPVGFAARVARRAFAGDVGSADVGMAGPRSLEPVGGLQGFLLRATAAAALLLIGLSGLMSRSQAPAGDALRAEDQAPPSLEELLRELDRLEQAPPEARR